MSRNEADSALRFYPVDLGYQAWDSHEVPRALLRIFRASWAAGRGQLQRGRDFFFFLPGGNFTSGQKTLEMPATILVHLAEA